MMHMTFYWGWQVTLLFDQWKTHSFLQYWASLLVLFAVSLFHEYVVSLRAHLRTSQLLKQTENFMEGQAMLLPGQFKKRACILKAGETVLFAVNALLGYLLMLAAMSYNGGVVLVIVLGLSVGFFWFRSGNYVAQEEELQLSSDPCSSCT
ncbi:hypothetical protein SUGI_0656690 [Cryptomeria japonica]|uniref:copper transporter 5 n=1 Tax=Cryptomeria japonica TaxID=3369 RepID=UPI002414CC53|nr:copper transporter 5 [Cryptomeria japonica]GLJ32643.1 hypothetical protein SUGI_0656690 [Cryptomeria japonica]